MTWLLTRLARIVCFFKGHDKDFISFTGVTHRCRHCKKEWW